MAEVAQEVAAHSPLGRKGRPDEITDAASWLVSPEASVVTGSDITVAGGLWSATTPRQP